MFPHTFSLLTTSVWKLVTVFHVLIDTTFVRAATVAINDAVVFSHTHTDPCWGIRPLHHKFRNQSTSQRSRFHPKETRQGNELQGSSCRTTFNFAQESLVIRMRTLFVSVSALELLRGFPSVSVLHMVTRNFSKPCLASYFDSFASSSSRYFSVSCTIRSISD